MPKKKVEETKVKKKVDNIDEKLKKELNDYIEETIKKCMTLELERNYKRIIREKSIKIIVKNMVITVLLLIIVYHLLH